jgi:hypothetical protein
MATIKKQLRMMVSLACLLLMGMGVQGQTHITMSMQNCSQPSPSTIAFDLYIVNDGTTALKLGAFSYGINYSSLILNGGSLTWAVESGTSQIAGFDYSFSHATNGAFHLRLTSNLPFNGTTAPVLPSGTPMKLGHFTVHFHGDQFAVESVPTRLPTKANRSG